MEQNLNCVSNTELQLFILPTSDTQFFPKSSVQPNIESNIHYYDSRKKVFGYEPGSGGCSTPHIVTQGRYECTLIEKRVSYAFCSSNENKYTKQCLLMGLLHPLTLIQNCFTCCIVFLLLVDKKGDNSQVEVYFLKLIQDLNQHNCISLSYPILKNKNVLM